MRLILELTILLFVILSVNKLSAETAINESPKVSNEQMIYSGSSAPFDGVIMGEDVYNYYVKKDRGFDELQTQLNLCNERKELCTVETSDGFNVEHVALSAFGGAIFGFIVGMIVAK